MSGEAIKTNSQYSLWIFYRFFMFFQSFFDMISAVVVCSWLGDGSWSWARTTSWGNSQSCWAGRGRWQLLDMATVGTWKPNKHLSLTFFQFFLLNHASLISTPIPGVSQQVWGLLEHMYKYLQKPTARPSPRHEIKAFRCKFSSMRSKKIQMLSFT